MCLRPLPTVLVALLLGVPVVPAGAQSTNWTASLGNWSAGANWSAGEPTAAVDAVFPQLGTATVNMAGETCRNLLIGNNGVSASVSIAAGGALAVAGTIRVPHVMSGAISHQAGTLSADSLIVGTVPFGIGQYIMTGGSLSVAHLLLGTTQNGTGTMTAGGLTSSVTVDHSLRIGRGGNFVSGGGSLTVGSSSADSLVVLGVYQMINRPTVTVSNFRVDDLAGVTVTILSTGITPVVSTGAAILGGMLTVFDVGAPNGTYELIRGNPLTGTFAVVVLPTVGDWSWRIEGNSFLVTKGTVAVEPTTWSRIKALGE
jgi:hypothetical protein